MKLSKEHLDDLYCKQGLMIYEIAAQTGFSKDTVSKYIKQFDLKRSVIRDDLCGVRFGKLLVVSFRCVVKYETFWNCQCDCGNKVFRSRSSLKQSLTAKECHCHRNQGVGSISGNVLHKIRSNARHRNIPFEVTASYLWELFEKQNHKCAISDVPLFFSKGSQSFQGTASLDRIDSGRGYIEGNLRWVHKELNRMKSNFPDDLFFRWLDIIAQHRSIK